MRVEAIDEGKPGGDQTAVVSGTLIDGRLHINQINCRCSATRPKDPTHFCFDGDSSHPSACGNHMPGERWSCDIRHVDCPECVGMINKCVVDLLKIRQARADEDRARREAASRTIKSRPSLTHWEKIGKTFGVVETWCDIDYHLAKSLGDRVTSVLSDVTCSSCKSIRSEYIAKLTASMSAALPVPPVVMPPALKDVPEEKINSFAKLLNKWRNL